MPEHFYVWKRYKYSKPELRSIGGSRDGIEVPLEALPERVWIVYLNDQLDKRRIVEKKCSPAILKIPRCAFIHTDFKSARKALQDAFEYDIQMMEQRSRVAARRAEEYRNLMIQKMAELGDEGFQTLLLMRGKS